MPDFETARNLFFEGLRFLEANDLQAAETRFARSLEIIPERVSTLNNLSAINALLLDRAARAQLLLGDAPIKAVSNDVDGLAKRKLLLSDSHQALRWGYLKRDLARKRGETDRSLKGPGRGRR